MRKTLIVAAAWAAAAVAGAQEPAAPANKTARIAVIDMDRLTQDSLLGKSYYARLEALNNDVEAERTKKRNELQKMENDIKTLADELEKQGALLSDEAAEKKRQEIVRKNRDREAYVEDGRAELERMQQKVQNQISVLTNEFRQKVQPHIEAVAKAQGVDVLLDTRYAMPINKAFDISDEVIVKLDDAERAARPAAAKPAAPAAKPTAAAPAPTKKP